MTDQEEPSDKPQEFRILEYLLVLRRRWWAVVLSILVVTSAAYTFAATQTPRYRASSQLLIKDPVSTNLFNSAGGAFLGSFPERIVATQIQLIQSRTTIESANKKLEQAGFPGGINGLSVASVGATNIIVVSTTSESPARAKAASQAVVEAYVENFRTETLAEAATQKAQLQPKIDALASRVADLDRQIGALQDQADAAGATAGAAAPTAPTSKAAAQLLALQKQRDDAKQQLDSYQGRVDELDIDATLRSQSVVLAVPADLPTNPFAPRPSRTATLGLIGGLMLGVAAAYFIDFLDDSVRTKADAEQAFGLTAMGLIPPAAVGKNDAGLVTITDPMSVPAESFRALRTNLRFVTAAWDAKVVMVTSPGPSEGKTFISINLAIVLAEAGQRVILVDGDLRRPRVHRVTRLDNTRGFSTAITGDGPLGDLLQTPRWDRVMNNVRILTAGPVPPNPSELLGLARTRAILDALREIADVVIVDSAPVVPVTDAAVLAAHCDGVIIVARAPSTSRRACRHSVDRLWATGGQLLGFVLNNATAESAELPSHYYYYPYAAGKRPRRRMRLLPWRRTYDTEDATGNGGNSKKVPVEEAGQQRR